MPFGGSCDPEGTIGPAGGVAGIRSDAAGATTRGPGRENGWHAGTGHRPGTSPTWVRVGKNGIERRKDRGAGSGRHWYGGVQEWERPRRRPSTVWIGKEGTLSVTRCVTSLPRCGREGEGRTGSADREGRHPLCHALSGVTSLPRSGREGEGSTESGHGGRGRWNARRARFHAGWRTWYMKSRSGPGWPRRRRALAAWARWWIEWTRPCRSMSESVARKCEPFESR